MANGNGWLKEKVHILYIILTGVLVVMFTVGGSWLAKAADKLDNVVNKDDVTEIIKDKTVSRTGIKEMIDVHSLPSKVKVKKLEEEMTDVKSDIKQIRNDQTDMKLSLERIVTLLTKDK